MKTKIENLEIIGVLEWSFSIKTGCAILFDLPSWHVCLLHTLVSSLCPGHSSEFCREKSPPFCSSAARPFFGPMRSKRNRFCTPLSQDLEQVLHVPQLDHTQKAAGTLICLSKP